MSGAGGAAAASGGGKKKKKANKKKKGKKGKAFKGGSAEDEDDGKSDEEGGHESPAPTPEVDEKAVREERERYEAAVKEEAADKAAEAEAAAKAKAEAEATAKSEATKIRAEEKVRRAAERKAREEAATMAEAAEVARKAEEKEAKHRAKKAERAARKAAAAVGAAEAAAAAEAAGLPAPVPPAAASAATPASSSSSSGGPPQGSHQRPSKGKQAGMPSAAVQQHAQRKAQADLELARRLQIEEEEAQGFTRATGGKPRAAKPAKVAPGGAPGGPGSWVHQAAAAPAAAAPASGFEGLTPAAGVEDLLWQCEVCTFHSRGLALVCEMCGGGRPATVTAVSSGFDGGVDDPFGAAARAMAAAHEASFEEAARQAAAAATAAVTAAAGGDVGLPAGWESAVDPASGNIYYISPDKKSTWDRPTPPPPAAPAAPVEEALPPELTGSSAAMWSCLACTYGNHPDRGICEMCQSPRGAASPAPAAAPTVQSDRKAAGSKAKTKAKPAQKHAGASPVPAGPSPPRAAAAATVGHGSDLSAPARVPSSGAGAGVKVVDRGFTAAELGARRIDPGDGSYYTREEFFDYYGSELSSAPFAPGGYLTMQSAVCINEKNDDNDGGRCAIYLRFLPMLTSGVAEWNKAKYAATCDFFTKSGRTCKKGDTCLFQHCMPQPFAPNGIIEVSDAPPAAPGAASATKDPKVIPGMAPTSRANPGASFSATTQNEAQANGAASLGPGGGDRGSPPPGFDVAPASWDPPPGTTSSGGVSPLGGGLGAGGDWGSSGSGTGTVNIAGDWSNSSPPPGFHPSLPNARQPTKASRIDEVLAFLGCTDATAKILEAEEYDTG